jgi:transcriptional regulator with XRE-family HTH domain
MTKKKATVPEKRRPGRQPLPPVMTGEALKAAREATGWSLRETALAMGISGASLHALEAGESNVSAKRAKELAAVWRQAKARLERGLAMVGVALTKKGVE